MSYLSLQPDARIKFPPQKTIVESSLFVGIPFQKWKAFLTILRMEENSFRLQLTDSNLNWKKHTHEIGKKISRGIGILSKLRHFVTIDILSYIIPWCILSWLIGGLLTIMQLEQVYCSIVRSVLEYACPVWAALPKYLGDAIESVQKRALRIVLPNGITAISQRKEEACTNFIKRDCLSSPVLRPLIPCASIDRRYCLRSGERAPVRFVANTKRFADFYTIKYQDQL